MTAVAANSLMFADQSDTIDRWLDDARETGTADAYAGKRRWVRYQWEAPVTVSVIGGKRGQPPQYAYTRDISRGGIGFKCRQKVAPMSMIRVMRDDTGETLCGRVRHCTSTVNGYLIGLEFEADPQASTEPLRRSA